MALSPEAQSEEMWRQVLIHGHGSRAVRIMNSLPKGPRCIVCRSPFRGIGGRMMKVMGRRVGRKSPHICNLCEELMPQGGAEVDIGVLFADVRGSTAIGERLGASQFADLLNRFYRAATDALLAHNAVIDKIVGDEVMALFIPAICGRNYRQAAVLGAEELLGALGFGNESEPLLPVGVGVQVGHAYVGKIGTEEVNDFTALGDTVNTAARLQAAASAGEIVLGEGAYQEVADRYPDAEKRALTPRGKEQEIAIRVLRLQASRATPL